MIGSSLFYSIKPLVPRSLQIFLRRRIARFKHRKYAHIWPIDPNSAKPPEGWSGWPAGKKFALVLSHDVDTRKGYDNVLRLVEFEEKMGFRSQFNFVPERYGKVEISLIEELKSLGFGIGVHGLKHDGKLFRSKDVFDESALKINCYLEEWGTRGFTAPSMLRNHDWMPKLKVDYCVSTFDTDPFEPESQGVGTIFPYWVKGESPGQGFLELPYTMVQDFTLFVILGEKTIDIWKHKLEWIASKGGMALLNTHPDYMNFDGGDCGPEEYPIQFYKQLLVWVKDRFADRYWHALPSQILQFWKTCSSRNEKNQSLN